MKCIVITVIIGSTGIVKNEKPGSYTRKTFDRFTTENSCTLNITQNTESTAL
jgi:hypothetical protein